MYADTIFFHLRKISGGGGTVLFCVYFIYVPGLFNYLGFKAHTEMEFSSHGNRQHYLKVRSTALLKSHFSLY